MSKTKQHTHKQHRNESESSGKAQGGSAPSASTYFRTYLVNTRMREMMAEAIAKFRPPLSIEEQEVEQLVQAAATPIELVRLAGRVKGVSEGEWSKKLRAQGLAVVPAIALRLKRSQSIPDEHERTKTIDNLVGALRWQGDAGAQALLDCFNNLDDYGQSLACVVLGLLHATGAGDKVWRYYQRVRTLDNSYIVGALWGLVDLQDARAADAVFEQWQAQTAINEIYGFVARSGDARMVVPLISEGAGARTNDERQGPFMALAAVIQRVGREESLARVLEMEDMTDGLRKILTSIVDKSLLVPQVSIEAEFDLYYMKGDEVVEGS